jgi:hypothetical protein
MLINDTHRVVYASHLCSNKCAADSQESKVVDTPTAGSGARSSGLFRSVNRIHRVKNWMKQVGRYGGHDVTVHSDATAGYSATDLLTIAGALFLFHTLYSPL